MLRASFWKACACLADHEPENMNVVDQSIAACFHHAMLAPNKPATIAPLAIPSLPKQA